MNRETILSLMQTQKPIKGVLCYDEAFCYYSLGVAGFLLMFRRKKYKPDGRRGFLLNDELAKCLGFDNLEQLKYNLTTLQFWRGWVSVERLRVAFQRYDERQYMFRQLAIKQRLI